MNLQISNTLRTLTVTHKGRSVTLTTRAPRTLTLSRQAKRGPPGPAGPPGPPGSLDDLPDLVLLFEGALIS